MDLAQARTEYIAYVAVERGLSVNTLDAYTRDLEGYLLWLKGKKITLPNQVTRSDVEEYIGSLRDLGMASASVERHTAALRNFHKFMAVEQICESSPAEDLPTAARIQRLPDVISQEKAEELLDQPFPNSPLGIRDRAILELLYGCGLRVSELCDLEVRGVLLEDELLRVFGKGSKERIVPLYESAIEWLKKYLSSSRPTLLLKDKAGRAHSALFISVRGNTMSADSLRKVFSSYLVAAGLDGSLSPHAMRHKYATELLGGGADLRIVQELLGHESLSTTQVYTHLSVDRLKEAAKAAHPRSK